MIQTELENDSSPPLTTVHIFSDKGSVMDHMEEQGLDALVIFYVQISVVRWLIHLLFGLVLGASLNVAF